MRFLADESCDFAIVRALRAYGYNVVAVVEVCICPGTEDEQVIKLALEGGRILLTEDKDFGQLVCAYGRETVGVILLRFPAPSRSKIVGSVVDFVKQYGEKLVGCFATVQPGKIRINPIQI